jgi:hypothetical protein
MKSSGLLGAFGRIFSEATAGLVSVRLREPCRLRYSLRFAFSDLICWFTRSFVEFMATNAAQLPATWLPSKGSRQTIPGRFRKGRSWVPKVGAWSGPFSIRPCAYGTEESNRSFYGRLVPKNALAALNRIRRGPLAASRNNFRLADNPPRTAHYAVSTTIRQVWSPVLADLE